MSKKGWQRGGCCKRREAVAAGREPYKEGKGGKRHGKEETGEQEKQEADGKAAEILAALESQ